MSPSSSARDPLDDGNAPWTGSFPAARPQETRPLPRADAGLAGDHGGMDGDTAAFPPVPAHDDAAAGPGGGAPRAGRTGVASGRLLPRDRQDEPGRPVGDGHLTRPQERISAEAAWDTMRPAVRPDGAGAATRPSAERVRTRQRERFGGMQFLPGLMGVLTALALGSVLLGIVAALGPGLGVDTPGSAGDVLTRAWNGPGNAQLWGGVVVLGLVELLSLLAGGYVAGRMARFSGVAQGLGVWLWSLVVRAAVSALALLWADALTGGASRWAVQEVIGAHPETGAVALAGTLVLGLAGALLGGAWGMRYHRKVDAWTISNAWE